MSEQISGSERMHLSGGSRRVLAAPDRRRIDAPARTLCWREDRGFRVVSRVTSSGGGTFWIGPRMQLVEAHPCHVSICQLPAAQMGEELLDGHRDNFAELIRIESLAGTRGGILSQAMRAAGGWRIPRATSVQPGSGLRQRSRPPRSVLERLRPPRPHVLRPRHREVRAGPL